MLTMWTYPFGNRQYLVWTPHGSRILVRYRRVEQKMFNPSTSYSKTIYTNGEGDELLIYFSIYIKGYTKSTPVSWESLHLH